MDHRVQVTGDQWDCVKKEIGEHSKGVKADFDSNKTFHSYNYLIIK